MTQGADTPVPVVHDDEHTYASRIARRVVLYVVDVFEALLLLRVALRMAGAPAASQFVRFVYLVTGPLVFPFRGLFGAVSADTPIEWAALTAMAAYAVSAWAVMRLGWAVAAHRDAVGHGSAEDDPPDRPGAARQRR